MLLQLALEATLKGDSTALGRVRTGPLPRDLALETVLSSAGDSD